MFNNQQEVYNKIIKDVRENNANKIIMLNGESGVGKSFILKKMMDTLQPSYSCPICYLVSNPGLITPPVRTTETALPV